MSRKWLAIAAKAAISILLIWYLIGRVDMSQVAARARTLDAGEALLALLVLAAQTGLVTMRWWLVAHATDTSLGLGAALRILVIGMFFNQTLPSSVGGDAVRVWLVSREGAPLGKAFNVVLCDRVLALVVLIAIIGASLPAIYGRIDDATTRGTLAILVALGATGLLGFLALGERLAYLLRRWKVTRPLGNLATDFHRLFVSPVQLAMLLTLSTVVHLLTVLVVTLLAWALELPITFVDSLIVMPTVLLLLTLPISVAGWGVREGAMVAGFGLLGIAAEGALAVSVLFGLAQIVTALPGGLVWLAGRPRTAPPPNVEGMPG